MFARLVQKELLHHLLDFRFVAVFGLCALLSGLSVYVGGQNYVRRLEEYNAVSENSRRSFQEASLDKGMLADLIWGGCEWNRRPETLSPVVYGLSGTLGQEVLIHYQRPPLFEASSFETDPIHALFEVLDLAFIVKVVLSLCVLLFTYDAICGEKEGGTLRLYASFPVSRSMLALAKLVGSTVAVLVPFVFAMLLASAVLALFPGMNMQAEEWVRMAVLMGVFTLYLTVFAAFGLFVSSLTHRRMTAFLGLLALWTLWLFVVPNLGVDIAGRFVPLNSYYELQKQDRAMRWKAVVGARTERRDYWQRNAVEDWDALPEAQQQKLRAGAVKIESRWNAKYYARLKDLQTERRNQMRRQQNLAVVLSAISPLGAVSFLSMDLARTGLAQQDRIEDSLNSYLIHLGQYIQEKASQGGIFGGVDLSDFSWFTYQDKETVGACLIRNAFHILNLALLALLGFAGAYVAILRYDVR